MRALNPGMGRIRNGSRTTNGTILTIPANHVLNATILLSASISVAGSVRPNVTVAGTGGDPVDGSVLHQLSLSGLALTTIVDNAQMDVVVIAGVNPLTLEFNTGGATMASVVVNGYVFPNPT